ncbi:MAG: L,D-transpeptidase family protein [Myxococcota bacterium]
MIRRLPPLSVAARLAPALLLWGLSLLAPTAARALDPAPPTPAAAAPDDADDEDEDGEDAPTAGAEAPEPEEDPASAAPDGPAPLSALDRHTLATIADSLPAHGVAPITVPANDDDDRAWHALARRLALVFAPRRQRHGARLRELLATRPLGPALEALVPRHRRYVALMHVLATERDLLAATPPKVPRTTYRVKVGVTAPEVGLLRERLLLEGYGDPEVTGRLVNYFDGRLKRALWAWQKDHDLPVTVWLDELTRARLNDPFAGGAEAVLLALARWRDIEFRVDSPRQIIVHINAQRLTAERDGAATLTMPVSVGRADADNQTPMLSSRVNKVTAHPSWRVPRRIVEDEMQPSVEGEPDALRARGYTVDINSRGDWKVTQAAGPDNPLGRVKFSLVATGGVYLHDTPNADQFKSARRSVSHGCVRLQSATTLAEWVLEGESRAEFNRAMAAATTRSFRPDPRVDVHLVYQTLSVAPDGRLVRYPDIYKLDPDEIAKLDARRVLAARPRPPRPPPPSIAASPAAPVATAPAAPAPAPAPAPARPLYGLRFAALDESERTVSLDSHAGRLTAIMFASETCAPCHDLAPGIVALAAELAKTGETLDFLAIDAEHAIGAPPRVWAEPLPAPVYRVPEPVLRGASPLGTIEVLPTLWIVGRTGVPLYRYEGAGPAVLAAIREDLQRYLAAEAGLRAQGAARSSDDASSKSTP